MKRVFCKDCVFFRKSTNLNISAGSCSAPGNSKEVYDWYTSRRVGTDCPSEINKNNDCTWFLKSGG